MLEPGLAAVTNRLGDILAHTSGYATVLGAAGLLDDAAPNLTRYVFTHPRARTFLPDWDDIADEQAFDLWLAPSAEASEWFSTELAPLAGPDFTRRLGNHLVPRRGPLRLHHPQGPELRLHRETLDLTADSQQLLVLLPADEETAFPPRPPPHPGPAPPPRHLLTATRSRPARHTWAPPAASTAARTNASTRADPSPSRQIGPRSIGGASWIGT